MARRSRLDAPGTWHHVMNRGVAKRPLFEDRADQRFFQARLAREVRKGRLEVHAYCLMTTHFHLLVRSPIGQMSEALRRIQNEHSRRFNRRRKRDGTLVRGRYFSKPVRSLTYRRTLVSYIDLNPVVAGLVRSRADHAAGSARAYLSASGPAWLTRSWIEPEACALAGTEEYSPAAYLAAFCGADASSLIELVDARMSSTALEDPLDDLIGASPRSVREWMQRKARLADGCRIGIPVCGSKALDSALATSQREEGPWVVEDGPWFRNGLDLARRGLLRSLCGFGWGAIAMTTAESVSRARRMAGHHRRLVVNDVRYAGRCARVARAAMKRSETPRRGA